MEVVGDIATWGLMFVTYSLAGWCMEVMYGLILNHKIVNRGFLIGPLCPIYGCGALVISFLTYKMDNVLEIFVISFIAGAIIEYATSYIMEKLFRVRWWDYSRYKLNINGRICLHNLIMFGVLGVIIACFVNPVFLSFYNYLNVNFRIALAIVVLCMVLADFALSLWLIIGFRVTVGTAQKDATEEITQHIREVLMEQGMLNRRLAKAFPNMEAKQKKAKKPRTKKVPKTKIQASTKSKSSTNSEAKNS